MPAHDDIERAKARRRRVLRLIRESISTRGYPPSISELAAATKVSTRSIRVDLDKLAEAGKIERDPKVTRGIRLL